MKINWNKCWCWCLILLTAAAAIWGAVRLTLAIKCPVPGIVLLALAGFLCHLYYGWSKTAR